MTELFENILELVNEEQLDLTEEGHESCNRARLVQGNSTLEKDKNLNKTVHYTGGIGLSIDGLPEEIVAKGTIVTLKSQDGKHSSDWVTFKELDVVVLASSRNRRLMLEVDGDFKTVCGSNTIGQNAAGWSGQACGTCPFNKKNMLVEQKNACASRINVLVYFPELDHTAIFTGKGSHYIETANWLDQVGTLSVKFAQRPEIKASNPNLKRVNSYFFKTSLKASEFKQIKANMVVSLAYSVVEQPYKWENLLNSAAVIKKCAEITTDMGEFWKGAFVNNPVDKIYVLPGQKPVAVLPAEAPIATSVITTQDNSQQSLLRPTTVTLDDDTDVPF